MKIRLDLPVGPPEVWTMAMNSIREFDLSPAKKKKYVIFGSDFSVNRTPGATSTSASEVLSINSVTSTSNSSVLNSAGLVPRLSPIFETTINHPGKSDDVAPLRSARTFGSYVEVLAPPFKPNPPPPKTDDTNTKDLAATTTAAAAPIITTTTTAASDLIFTRRVIPTLRPLTSSLTAMLASSSISENPFTELYGAISGRAESASLTLTVFFPHAVGTKKQQSHSQPQPMQLVVRRDATVEEVIGYSLLVYWEEGWLPRLDEGLAAGSEDPRWAIRLSAVGWIMRIAEEDGEVDDEFPRMLFFFFCWI
jgi:target of rapamycin complex 2 subunit MAPKAP1